MSSSLTFISFSENVQQHEATTPASSENRSVTFSAEPTDLEHNVSAFKRDLMGVDPEDSVTGPPVHDLIPKTWSSIFTNGLSKETRLALRKKYPVPQNLLLAKAPTLNVEVRRVIPVTSVRRDEYQVVSQGIVEAAIAAQACLMSELLKPEEQWDAKRIFEIASDAGRLTSQVQHHLSKARRALIMPMLTPSARNALDVSPIDTQLFGEQYLHKMKDAAAADKLIRSLTTVNTSVARPHPTSRERAPFQPKPLLQGNARAFASRPTLRRGAKAFPQTTRHRSNSQTRRRRPPF